MRGTSTTLILTDGSIHVTFGFHTDVLHCKMSCIYCVISAISYIELVDCVRLLFSYLFMVKVSFKLLLKILDFKAHVLDWVVCFCHSPGLFAYV